MRIEIDGLVQGYGDNIVLDGLSFHLETGELVSILGPNGCGKSTFIKTLCKILAPKEGRIALDGTDVRDYSMKEFAKHVAYVPQTSTTFGNSTVFESVLIGRRPYIDWDYGPGDLAIAAEALRIMHIDDLHDRNISILSGGQRQRAHIARAIAQNSDFFILDEPTSSLDLKHQIDTMAIMKELSLKGKGAVVALHDLNLAMNYSDRVIVLGNKHIYDMGRPEDVITERMISDVYGVRAKIVRDEYGTFVHPFRPVWERPNLDRRRPASYVSRIHSSSVA